MSDKPTTIISQWMHDNFHKNNLDAMQLEVMEEMYRCPFCKIDKLETIIKQQADNKIVEFEREITTKEFYNCMYDFADGCPDNWFEMPEHHYEQGGMIWYGLERNLLERSADNFNQVRIKL